MENSERYQRLPWLGVSLLAVLCAVLAILQYRWIGEITGAHRQKLKDELQSKLNLLSRTFNDEISHSAFALMPPAAEIEKLGREVAYSAQFRRWKETHEPLFRRIALAVPEGGSLALLNLDQAGGEFARADWPPEWESMRQRLTARLLRGPMPPPLQNSTLFELPRFSVPRGTGLPEREWLILEINVDVVRTSVLPDLVARYIGSDYDTEVAVNGEPSQVIYRSAPGSSHRIGSAADASAMLLDLRLGGLFAPGAFGARGGAGGPPPDPGRGRWRLLVRHRAGSLEALVAKARLRSVAISGAVLLLILATAALLVRFSRQAQQLAELQMNFVAGISHELRTPLTVIRTAAFNLRGKLAARPDQVERYGKLIQEESEKLAAMLEQVLRFAGAKAGHAIREREPVAIQPLIENSLQSSGAALHDHRIVVEKRIDPDLPLVLADEMALKNALQNLVDNALKYGTEGSHWIGIFASAVSDERGRAVEIRVADRGPGIPPDEQDQIFDAFFRGRRAIQDQVHGTGLGLNLVKTIVEAHGGEIRVKSEPMHGTEFIVRIPAAPAEAKNEFAHSPG